MLVMIPSLLLLLLRPLLIHAVCPYLEEGTPPSNTAQIPEYDIYLQELDQLNIPAVFNDLFYLLTNSQDCWPADTFNGESSYGPLMIRLAWHCSGTFRNTDGLGGCAGGRQRFYPESSWPDNVNLDKARALLYPIKERYGDALSWGDLFVFAGTAAILQMGGPATTICAGRIDDGNGTKSIPLTANCTVNGNCSEPFGADTMGLIYVNPEGVMGDPDPATSAVRIREIFGRMGMNDSFTVALIGGGHAFGKSHGACPDGPGPGPDEQPYDPWPGECGTGMEEDTYTSGIEGQWTTNPLKWDNEYFQQLLSYSNEEMNYTLDKGDGDKYQWTNDENGYMMLTTDIALIEDDIYLQIVEEFANDLEALNDTFGRAWELLVTNGNGWVTNKKCVDASYLMAAVANITTTEVVDVEDDKTMTDAETTWFIIGVTFICLFAVSICIIGYLGYRVYSQNSSNKKASDGKGSYQKSNNHDTALVAEQSH